jgi:trehalose utilization protein
MLTPTEIDLMAHALGHESNQGAVTWKHGANRNYFAASPGSDDDQTWARLAALGYAKLVRAPVCDVFPDNTWSVTDVGRAEFLVSGSRDALGQPIASDGRYYIEDVRQVVGNCVLWWGKNRAGYTCTLDDAGVYTGTEAAGIIGMRSESTDHAWPEAFILERVVRHVRVEPLNHARAEPLRRPVEKRASARRAR